jgi:hypothetical protein
MASFPTNGDYVQALQNTDICFHDPILKGGRVGLDPMGMPKPITGNFASVFSITSSSGDRYAVKCFTREVKGQHRRYEAIHDALASLARPWQVGFDYIGQGVLVDGKWRAILRMEWVENSTTLIPWLEANLGRPDRILEVAKQFAACVSDLQRAGIAHGDLQHGNLLIDSQQRLRVIDYDGMFVPSIQDLGSNELGLANYQYPARRTSDFGPYLDRFSAWLIYGSLLSLAAQPSLWKTFRNGADEKLLLGKEDFTPPLTTLQRMKSLGSPHDEFAAVLQESLASSGSIAQVPEFDPKRIPMPADNFGSPLAPGAPSDWWRDPADISGTEPLADHSTEAAPLGSGWLKTHEPPLPPVDVVGLSRASKLTGITISAIALLASVVFGTTSSVLIAGLVLVVWAVSITAATWMLWHRSDAVSGRTKARRQVKRAERGLTKQKAQVSKALKERAAIDGAELKALQNLENERSKLPKARAAEIERESKTLRKQIEKLQDPLRKLVAAKATESAQLLKASQEQHIQTYLASRRIEPGVIHGIGPTLVANLSAHGLRTAADFSGFNGSQFRKPGSSHWFTVSGIGPAKSISIKVWHQFALAAASQGAPRSLTAQQVQALDNKFAAQERQKQAAVDAAAQQLNGVQTTVEAKYTGLDRDISRKESAVQTDYIQLRSVCDAAVAQAKVELREHEGALSEAQRELARYQAVSLGAYLKA